MSSRFKKNQKIVRIIIFLILVVLMLFAFLLYKNGMMFLYGIFSNMAGAFGVIAILAVIYRYLGGEPLQKEVNELGRQVSKFKQINRVTSTALDAGLVEIIPERQETVDKEWSRLISSNEIFPAKIDVLSMLMRPVVSSLTNDNGRERIIAEINKGCNIRLLLLKPKGDAAITRATHDTGLVEFTAKDPASLNKLKDVVAEIKNKTKKKQGAFECKLYDTIPYCQVLRIGEQMLVTNYLHGLSGRHCPTLRLQKNKGIGLFKTYTDIIDKVFRDATPISKHYSDETERIH